MMSACFLYQFIMASTSSNYNKNGASGTNLPIESDMEEKMNVAPTEVVGVLSMTPVLTHDTESCKTIVSNLDYSVSAEPKSDERKEDTSKTKETPDVLVDNESTEKGLIEEEKNIRLSRESPEVYLIRNQKEWLKKRMLLAILLLYRTLLSSAQ